MGASATAIDHEEFLEWERQPLREALDPLSQWTLVERRKLVEAGRDEVGVSEGWARTRLLRKEYGRT